MIRHSRSKQIFIVLVVLLGLMSQAQAQSGRQYYRMDFGWTFTLGDPSLAEKANFDDSAWRKLDIPHDWSIEGPWTEQSPSGSAGGYAPIGIG